jgi:hypothetical protein
MSRSLKPDVHGNCGFLMASLVTKTECWSTNAYELNEERLFNTADVEQKCKM